MVTNRFHRHVNQALTAPLDFPHNQYHVSYSEDST